MGELNDRKTNSQVLALTCIEAVEAQIRQLSYP